MGTWFVERSVLGHFRQSGGSCGSSVLKEWCLEHLQDQVAIEICFGVSV